MATQVENNVLAIRGAFDIQLSMNQGRELKDVREEIQSKQIPETEFEKLNELMKLDAVLDNLEICLCKSHDLGKREDFK